MFTTDKERLTADNILKYVDQWDIIKTYVPEANLKKPFFTPFREETKPSANIINSNGVLFLKDFGSIAKARSCFSIVMDLFNMSFPQALEKVRSDFNITQVERHSIGKPSTTVITSTPSKASTVRMQVEKTILVKYRDWLLIDKEFWNGQYHISRETLQKFGVSPISDYWINGTYFVASQLSYLYYYFISEDDRHIVKIYQPRNRNLKWISNSGHLQVIQGEGMLPKTGDLLIITKSLKDIMVLYEMGYTAIAPQSENTIINGAYFEKQKQRFKRIVLFYDNDAAGRTASKFFAEQHNLSTIFIPSYYYSHYKIKDISDYVKYFSFLKGRGLLNYLLNE